MQRVCGEVAAGSLLRRARAGRWRHGLVYGAALRIEGEEGEVARSMRLCRRAARDGKCSAAVWPGPYLVITE